MRSSAVLALAAAALLAAPVAARAQATRADSAAMLFDAARRLDSEGNRAAASAMLDQILRRFADTPAADSARARLAARPGEGERSGRLELLGWGALQGAWLGLAIPLALGVEGSSAYGATIIAGVGGGLWMSHLYLNAYHPTLGQARAMTFAFRWGTWQAVGWMSALTSGVDQQTGWTVVALGGIGAEAFAAVYGRHRTVPVGLMLAGSHGAYWGTWFGLMADGLLTIKGDAALGTILAAGDAGLLAALATAPREISTGRVWLTTAAGIAGAAVGGGLDLIIQPQNAKVAILLPTIGSAAGLAVGVAMAKGTETVRSASAPGADTRPAVALLQVDEAGTRLALPSPMPTLVQVGERGPRRLYRPAVAIPLFHAAF